MGPIGGANQRVKAKAGKIHSLHRELSSSSEVTGKDQDRWLLILHA